MLLQSEFQQHQLEILKAGKHLLDLNTPLCMGVINVTPDSFSDGGGFSKNTTNLFEVDISKVLQRVESYVEDGVSIIDIGGESTRPGATSVAPDIELHRTIPVIEACLLYTSPSPRDRG